MKLSRVQLLIARRLTEAKQTIPHFYVSSEVDMTDALVMRQSINATAGEEGVKVSVNGLIVKPKPSSPRLATIGSRQPT